ncbi:MULTISPECIES: TetR/AcrR family transcriptional regulator [Actinomadura]|jgi:TetR/AcrR family transcriptional repressor of lmrAB and yxaGH operons|uniref:AcrR family transcriptional regulator n=1 Tax=Actinomadura citrea TaxID=46158 RepID=A0A7Y9KDY3_9ACTN|nr:TetR/AcrR family transcriptional regulator [Actinomadura citrea]NYE12054.1 AcrR family transcriptional regulator [Actinomadura citrea]GGT49241.1 putative transcriptional regulator, TetR family protein [Actinomadura citrea]
MTRDTRTRLLEASAQLFREQGYAGTGLKQITAAGEAPWGSLYHFFPGGKEQLGAEAVRHSGDRYLRLFDLVFAQADQDLGRSVLDMFRLSAEALERSEWGDGCPIATVALEVASTSEPLRHACAEVFASWELSLARRLAGAGIAEGRAKDVATYVLSAFEGALVLSRTAHDVRPLEVTAAMVAGTVRAELG